MEAAVNLRFEYNQYVLYESGDRNADNIWRIFSVRLLSVDFVIT